MSRPIIPGCPTCNEAGRKGNCAPLRCYCGHESCHAFASWVPLHSLSIVTPLRQPTPTRDSWASREESTWIDKL